MIYTGHLELGFSNIGDSDGLII